MNFENLKEKAQRQGVQRFVAGAVIIRQGKFLILKRKQGDFLSGLWELASGKLEENETLIEGLKREVEEETGLKVEKVLKYLSDFDYVSGSGKKTRQFNFLVEVGEGDIKLSEHEDFAWITNDESVKYNISDSVKKIFSDLI